MRELEQIKFKLSHKDPEVRINALFDAYEHSEAGIELIAQALKSKTREVRQAALILLGESGTEIAKQALWNYLPFSEIQCLHIIKEFEFDSFDAQQFHPDYFAISDYNNTLVSYWDVTYKASGAAVWNLETGKVQQDFYLMAHDFGLGKKGKIFISSYQDVIIPPQDIETQKLPDNYLQGISKMRGIEPIGFAVSKNEKPLVSIIETRQTTKVESNNKILVNLGKLRIWNYETYSCLLDYEFENLVLPQTNYFGCFIKKSTNFSKSSITFTSDERFLIICLVNKQKHYIVEIWDIEEIKLIQIISNLPKIAVTSASVRFDGTIIACGIRENKVCAWELQTDKIIFTTDEICPCILSNNGRVLIYATANYEIVVRDLVEERELCRLTGHKAPIAYLTLSEDYEFIASYSTDRQIKIWGISDYSLE